MAHGCMGAFTLQNHTYSRLESVSVVSVCLKAGSQRGPDDLQSQGRALAVGTQQQQAVEHKQMRMRIHNAQLSLSGICDDTIPAGPRLTHL